MNGFDVEASSERQFDVDDRCQSIVPFHTGSHIGSQFAFIHRRITQKAVTKHIGADLHNYVAFARWLCSLLVRKVCATNNGKYRMVRDFWTNLCLPNPSWLGPVLCFNSIASSKFGHFQLFKQAKMAVPTANHANHRHQSGFVPINSPSQTSQSSVLNSTKKE
jgi:hypothetical protein